ncbi:MAG: hypothetical protein ACJ8C4_04575 [Gemmataceae bacterium]
MQEKVAKRGLFVASPEGVGAGFDFTDPGSGLAGYYLPIGHVAAALILSLIFVILNATPLWHTDLWAHIRFGENILQSHAFPEGEPFTQFGDKSAGQFVGPWLSQVAYAETYQIGAALGHSDSLGGLLGGADAIRFLHACLVTARFAFLYWAFLRLTRSSALSAIGIAVVLAMSVGNIAIARPQAFGETILAALLVALSRPVLSVRGVVSVTILMVLWANFHGSYPVGFMVMGGLAIGRVLSVWWHSGNFLADASVRRLLIMLATSLVAVALLNPEGPRIFLTTIQMGQNPNVLAMDEWQPIISQRAIGAQIIFTACLLLVTITLFLYRSWLGADAWVLLLIFGTSAALHQRGLIWFIPLTVWIIMPYWGAVLDKWRPSAWDSVPSLRKTMVVAAMAVLAIGLSAPVRLLTSKPLDWNHAFSDGTPWQLALELQDPSRDPKSKLAQQVRATYPNGAFTGTIFPTEVLGDFFVFETPNIPVYIYSHVHLFTPEHWQHYRQVLDGAENWRAVLDAAHVNLIIVTAENNESLRTRIGNDKRWLVLFDEAGDPAKRDPRCRLFAAIRRKPL